VKPDDPRDEDAGNRDKALLALVFVALLVLGGLYLIHVLTGMSHSQDCLMQGRSNCAPIDTTTSN